MKQATLLLKIGCELGEGCVWDEKRNRLYFIDITGRQLHCYLPEQNELTSMPVSNLIGTIILYVDGTLLALERHSLYHINFDEKTEVFLQRLPFHEELRFNDGKCDRFGHVWVGTMAINQDEPSSKGAGSLYCLEPHLDNKKGDFKVRQCLTNYTIPNGLAWSSNDEVFYHIDTPKHVINRFSVTKQGLINEKRTLLSISEQEGLPDGMTIDRDGNLWIAMWGGSKVVCYDPRTGEKIDEIHVPEKYVTCVAFGGSDMHTLYITTAKNGQKEGGNLYYIRLDQKGRAAYRLS